MVIQRRLGLNLKHIQITWITSEVIRVIWIWFLWRTDLSSYI